MRNPNRYKVTNSCNEHEAWTSRAEVAASVAALLGPGAQVRVILDRRTYVVWREGREDASASASYDATARVILKREREARATAVAMRFPGFSG